MVEPEPGAAGSGAADGVQPARTLLQLACWDLYKTVRRGPCAVAPMPEHVCIYGAHDSGLAIGD